MHYRELLDKVRDWEDSESSAKVIMEIILTKLKTIKYHWYLIFNKYISFPFPGAETDIWQGGAWFFFVHTLEFFFLQPLEFFSCTP